ncbi:hypothetical protein LCGC14_1486780 [marine sediment metagenome]|uniref:Uncharacterized protein n=1 Tax=marine sediment metagenome TaxID=412755 RepID=A0A0F9J8M4_9ZZZZ
MKVKKIRDITCNEKINNLFITPDNIYLIFIIKVNFYQKSQVLSLSQR